MANVPAALSAAEQEYLESLFWLYEAGLPMTGANLSRAMQLSAPTVHEMLGRLDLQGARVVEHPATLEVRMLGCSKMKTT